MKKVWIFALLLGLQGGVRAAFAHPGSGAYNASVEEGGVSLSVLQNAQQPLPNKAPKIISLHHTPDAVLFVRELPPVYSNVLEAMAGRFAGVWVSGSANQFVVRIRGALGPPLVVIDDIPFICRNDAEFNSLIQTIPPMDVDRIEIVKNPAMALMYGPCTSNGVIAIYTKRGEAL